jgi:hypothetical protein
MIRRSLLLAAFATLALPAAAQAVTVIPTTVGVFTQGIGMSSWTNLSGALEREGGGYSNFAETEEGKLRFQMMAKGIVLTGFHLSLPANAVVCPTCVKVKYRVRNSLGQPFWTTNIVSLVSEGVPLVEQSWKAFVGVGVTLEESKPEAWCMGGKMWCPPLTGAKVDKPDFGVMIQPESLTEEGQGLRVYGVDDVTLEVAYEPPASPLRVLRAR